MTHVVEPPCFPFNLPKCLNLIARFPPGVIVLARDGIPGIEADTRGIVEGVSADGEHFIVSFEAGERDTIMCDRISPENLDFAFF